MEAFKLAVKKGAPKLALSLADGAFPIGDIISAAWLAYDVYTIMQAKAEAQSIPEEDKDSIAEHSHNQGHGNEWDLDEPDVEGIKDRIDDVLKNPDTQVGKGVDKKTGKPTTGYLAPDGTLVIHNPSAPDKGTVFKPDDPQSYFQQNFPGQ